jgi:hypothetical protein
MGTGPDDLAGAAGLLAERARLLAARAAGEPRSGMDRAPVAALPETDPDLDLVRLGRELGILAGDALRLAVDRAQANGRTWAQIGAPLGISPQAAFQRFGQHPAGPLAGQPAAPVIADAADRAVAVLADWFEERYVAVVAAFDETLAERFPVDGLAAARAHLVGTAGPYRRLGDAEPLVRQAGDYTVADVPLVFEGGLMKGRVTFDRTGRVAGLYVLPSATP